MKKKEDFDCNERSRPVFVTLVRSGAGFLVPPRTRASSSSVKVCDDLGIDKFSLKFYFASGAVVECVREESLSFLANVCVCWWHSPPDAADWNEREVNAFFHHTHTHTEKTQATSNVL